MDIKGLRTLNLAGTILFAVIGCLLPVSYSMGAFILYNRTCSTILFIWFCVIFTFALLFYRYTVIGLDRGEYNAARNWTIVAVVFGLAGGIIPFIIFLISLVSFDDAIRQKYYGYPPPIYYQYPAQYPQNRNYSHHPPPRHSPQPRKRRYRDESIRRY